MTDLVHTLQDEGLREALAPYTLSGPLGHLLDAQTEDLGEGRLQVFEMSHLMALGQKHLVPILLYLFHRVEQRLETGTPSLVIVEEAWITALHSLFGTTLESWLRTLRKKNAAVVFVSQSVAGLSLNEEKTRVVDAKDGFDFLGVHFRLRPMRSNPRRLFCYRWPATKAMQSVRQKVRDAVGYDDRYSLDDKIRVLNPILRGWGQYFRIGNAHRHFKKVDSYVYTKLTNFLRRKHKRRGKGHREFPPSFFKKAGLYRLHGTIVRVFRTPPGERGRKAG